uniref:phenylalanine--tRNA ligase n=1 Tax=Oncorhynchus tshawytscha TaxID=74940 RepID=A0AAZ3SLN6_ONCTS
MCGPLPQGSIMILIMVVCFPAQVISADQRSSKHWELTGEGCEIAEQAAMRPECQLHPRGRDAQSQLMVRGPAGLGKVGFSARPCPTSVGSVLMDIEQGGPRIFKTVEHLEDLVRDKLLLVQKGQASQLEEKEKNELKKRKLLSEVTVKSYWITKGSCFSTTITKQETDGSWKEKKFKPYNFEALGVAPDCGHLHPLMKVRTQFRQIFLEMGFTEMPTNNFIESSFWNFDSLFQPPAAPNPAQAHEFPQDYLERVRKVHSEGGFGSQGYKYDWKIEEAQKNILRTHTTAVSARMLYKLAQQEKFTPVKYFSIDRVFRNETLDATHLAEFHQIEGVVADYGLTLGDLMGILHQNHQITLKPAYNPYTEPSMEVFSYMKKWVEVGNSGMFRPEMLLPMGLPEGPTMIKYGINNIRELVGHKVNLQMVYDSPVCRLDS